MKFSIIIAQLLLAAIAVNAVDVHLGRRQGQGGKAGQGGKGGGSGPGGTPGQDGQDGQDGQSGANAPPESFFGLSATAPSATVSGADTSITGVITAENGQTTSFSDPSGMFTNSTTLTRDNTGSTTGTSTDTTSSTQTKPTHSTSIPEATGAASLNFFNAFSFGEYAVLALAPAFGLRYLL
jgi:hypothetical protein